jgi:putative FmdB family regulatory protein
MPLYDYLCDACAWREERRVPLATLNEAQFCSRCGAPTTRQISAVMGRMAGQYGKGGGADRFTADMLGCRVGDLPPGLKEGVTA